MKGLVDLLVSFGPVGVLILALLDSSGVPIPAAVDALLVVIATVDPTRAYKSAGLAVIGSVAGNMFLFLVARKGGQLYLDRFTAVGRGAQFRRWFLRYGLTTVFIPALLPIPLPLKVFVISAGAMGVHPLTFLAVISIARIPRYFGLAYLGEQLGEHSMQYLKDHIWEMLAFSVLLFLALMLAVKLSERYRTPPPAY
ncbi:MAG: YqaA family protein [Bryobacteraceae bacterium]